jgi:multidrug efflux pump subunit AcrB
LSALATIVRQEDPTITNGVALIVTPFPGATAERVESLVTKKIEAELQQIQEVDIIDSTSRAGISVINVQIDASISGDAATAPIFSRMRDALDDAQAELPAGALEPTFDDERFGAYTSILGVVWGGEGPPPQIILQRYASELEDLLRGVSGTDHVKVFGASEERVEVRYDPTRLAAAGLEASSIARALAAADAKVAAGVLRAPEQNVLLEVSGELEDLDRVRAVPLARGRKGGTLRLGDVADVERAAASPPTERARVDGARGVLVAAQLAAGERFDEWAERLRTRVDAFRARLPEGVELVEVFDQTTYTRARLSGLFSNLLVGLGLVVVVLFTTLGWRAALVVTAALPLVTLASVVVLRVMGVPIHQMSVTGLIVALGLLVDNAIVVTDAIRSKRLEGRSRLDAVGASLRHLRVPLFASTLTTVLAFMPILLLPGRVGEFVGTIGLSVIVALLASYVLAMTVIAGLAGRFLPKAQTHRPGFWTTGIRLPRLTRRFSESLDWSLEHPKRSMALASVLPLLGFLASSQLPRQFFPPADRDQFHLSLNMPPASSIEATTRAAAEVEDILQDEPAVEQMTWTIGRSAPPFYYNMLQDQEGNPAFAQALVHVESVSDVQRLLPELQTRVDEAVPGAQVILRELLQGPPVNAPLEYRIHGPDIEALRRIGEALRLRMSRVPVVTHTTASLTASSPKLRLHLDEVEALGAGLRPVSVAGRLQLALEGTDGGSVLEGTEELPVRVRAHDAARQELPELLALPLLTGRGAVPLSAVTAPELVPVLDGIPRRDGERVNVVRGYTTAGIYPDVAFSRLEAILDADPLDLPPGYRMEIGGDAEKRGDAMGDLFASVPVLVLLMVASVGLSLNSYRLAGVVFATAFQAMGFGLLSLSLLGFPLGFQAMIGTIGLVGVAINAGIVISSALQADRRALAGDTSRMRAIVLGETSRHIISTTITTFGGFLPLILSPGGFWPPFASVIAGGVVLSTIGSFYFVPAAFALLTRRRPLRPFGQEVAS